MCIYGIELLSDNIAECRANLLEIFAGYLDLQETDDLYLAANYVLSQNLVHGDAMKMLNHDGRAILFAEWGYLGKGKFQRRDFRLESLTDSSNYSTEDLLFSQLGKHELFRPTKTYPPLPCDAPRLVSMKTASTDSLPNASRFRSKFSHQKSSCTRLKSVVATPFPTGTVRFWPPQVSAVVATSTRNTRRANTRSPRAFKATTEIYGSSAWSIRGRVTGANVGRAVNTQMVLAY